MKRLFTLLREDHAKRQCYFRDAGPEIAKRNLYLLKFLGLAVCGLTLFLILATPLIIPGWNLTLPHLLLFPVGTAMYSGAVLCQRRNGRGIQALCLLSEALLFFIASLLDLFPTDSPSSFMPLLIIVLPLLFSLPLSLSYSLSLFSTITYMIAVCVLKSPAVIPHDVFTVLTGLAFSCPMVQVVTRLQIRDHEIQMKYQQLSTRDSLSGILNKHAWEASVRQYLAGRQPDVSCILLILDIDDFKHVNDQLGHYTGDVFLHFVGDLLSSVFRTSDIIGRFGGDEFVILMRDTANQTVLEEKCKLIQSRFSQAPIEAAVSCSIGCVAVNEQTAEFTSLFRQADSALYEAKRDGKNRFIIKSYES